MANKEFIDLFPPNFEGHSNAFISQALGYIPTCSSHDIDTLKRTRSLIHVQQEDYDLFEYFRNTGEANDSLHINTLYLSSEPNQNTPKLLALRQNTREILSVDGVFGGYSEFGFAMVEVDNSYVIDSHVSLNHLKSSLSPTLEAISIQRRIVEGNDLVFGQLIPRDSQFTRRYQEDPSDIIYLYVFPDSVYVINAQEEIIAELPHEVLRKQEHIDVSFSLDSISAKITAKVDCLTFVAQLGRKLKPTVFDIIGAKDEQWLTRSGIQLFRVPLDRAN